MRVILFYLTIFLIAEVTAIASLLNFISQVPLWITAGVTLIICLLYILRGGFRLSIITDKYQFSFIILIILGSVFLILGNIDSSMQVSPVRLLSAQVNSTLSS